MLVSTVARVSSAHSSNGLLSLEHGRARAGTAPKCNMARNSLLSSQRAFAKGAVKGFGERALHMTRRNVQKRAESPRAASEAEEEHAVAVQKLMSKIRWLPPVKPNEDYMYPEEADEGKTEWPCFPLGMGYIPGTEHVSIASVPR
eukprot:2017915-Pyramimonas_sp.AAC.4